MTDPITRTIEMFVLLLLSGSIEFILTRKYPYVGKRFSTGNLIVFTPLFGVLVQPVLLPSWGLSSPPAWLVVAGFVLWALGVVGYTLAKLEVGSHAVEAVVPEEGYVSTGIYRYLRHPMYVSFALVIAGISAIGASIFSLVAVTTATLVYWLKAREEDRLRMVHENAGD